MPLPLPLLPFEENMLLDDRPAYPMSFFMRLRFSGRIEKQRLQGALEVTQARHPLLAATVENKSKNRLQWTVADDPRPQMVWLEDLPTEEFPKAEHLPLRKEVGLRVIVVACDESTDLLLQFHHSCCDGMGALQFIDDLLTAYASSAGTSSAKNKCKSLDPRRLKRRNHFGLTPWKLFKIIPKQLVGLEGVWQFMKRKPVPVLPHQAVPDSQELPTEYPTALVHRFDATETLAIREAAKREGVTTNDLLARDLFLALSDWRGRHHPGNGSDWLRLSIPMNLRTKSDAQLPAANVVSMVFLDRRDPQFDDAGKLLASIHEEMSLIKRLQLGFTYIFSLRAFKMLPGGLSRSSRVDECLSSAVLTNLGKVLGRSRLPRTDQGQIIVDDLVLNDIDGLAPIRPLTCAAFSLINYSRRLNIALHYDPRPLSKELAGDLLDTYVRFVQKSIRNVPDEQLTPVARN